MSPTLQILLAVLAFGLSAFFATRLRLTMGGKGGTRYVSSWFEISQLKSKAARTHVNRTVLKMGWVWVLICAPLMTYIPKSGLNLNNYRAILLDFDWKIYIAFLLGCVLLGIILGAVAYHEIESFDSVEINAEVVDMEAVQHLANMELQGYDKDDVERIFKEARMVAMVKAQQAARERAKGPVRRSNRVIFFTVILTTSLVPLLRLVAVWLSGFSTTWYIVSVAGFGLLTLMIYGLITYRV